MSFGKSKARMLNKEDNKKNFKDVAGIDESKDEVQEIVDFLKNPKKFTNWYCFGQWDFTWDYK